MTGAPAAVAGLVTITTAGRRREHTWNTWAVSYSTQNKVDINNSYNNYTSTPSRCHLTAHCTVPRENLLIPLLLDPALADSACRSPASPSDPGVPHAYSVPEIQRVLLNILEQQFPKIAEQSVDQTSSNQGTNAKASI